MHGIRVPHTLRCFPMMFPLFPMTTAVFQIVSPCASSRSRMGQMTTMPHFRAYLYIHTYNDNPCKDTNQPLCPTSAHLWQNSTLSPVSADSANSHHCFSRVQKAKGIGLIWHCHNCGTRYPWLTEFKSMTSEDFNEWYTLRHPNPSKEQK